MHAFDELMIYCAVLTKNSIEKTQRKVVQNLTRRARTTDVKALQVLNMQRVVCAVGIFSMFDAALQDALEVSDGFQQAKRMLDEAGRQDIGERFILFERAINVLKHGRGRSYNLLLSHPTPLPFRVRQPHESFFTEGDVSEISTLIEVDVEFLEGCAKVISDVSEALRRVDRRIAM